MLIPGFLAIGKRKLGDGRNNRHKLTIKRKEGVRDAATGRARGALSAKNGKQGQHTWCQKKPMKDG